VTSLRIAAVALCLAAVPSIAGADVVLLASGEEVVGRVVSESAREVVVEVASGLVRIERSRVIEVERETARAEAYEGWAAATKERANRAAAERKALERVADAARERARAAAAAAAGGARPAEEPGPLWDPDPVDPAVESLLPPLGARPAPAALRPSDAPPSLADVARGLPEAATRGAVTALAATPEAARRLLDATEKARAAISAWTGAASLELPLVACLVPRALWPSDDLTDGYATPPLGPGAPRAWIVLREGHPRLYRDVLPHEVGHVLTGVAIGGVANDLREAPATLCETRASFEGRLDRLRRTMADGRSRFEEAAFTEMASHDEQAAEAAFLLARGGGRERFLRLLRRRLDTDLEMALRDVYGFPTLAEARKGLLAWLRARPVVEPDPVATADAPRG